MGKIVTCPVKRFAGTVTLRDPMDFRMLTRWDEALGAVDFATPALRKKYGLPERADADERPPSAYINERFHLIQEKLYPLVIEMVEAWDLKNVAPPITTENFPNASAGTSGDSIHALTAWLITECKKIRDGAEDDDPNE